MDLSLRLLRSRPTFRWYWAAQSISSAGSQVTSMLTRAIRTLTTPAQSTT